jgi:phosphatidylethanolamine-binding protein (PEBP) family uncharacterized protein
MKTMYMKAAAIVMAFSLLCGCKGKPFEPQHKTEIETENLSVGIFPQIIEKNVSYIQKEKDGAWEVEKSEETKWDLGDTSVLADSAWRIVADDATSLNPALEDFKGVSAVVYLHFGKDLGEVKAVPGTNADGTPKIDVTFNTVGDLVFCAGVQKFGFEEVKMCAAEVQKDGSAKLTMDWGEGETVVNIPAKADKLEWKDYLIAKSDTYIKDVPFKDVTTINVTSKTLDNGIWDTKISKTLNGQNVNPELSWDPVEGATQYVVIMLDGGWLHMDYITTNTSMAEGEIDSSFRSNRGKQYVGPYPPSGTTHTYTVFVFALKNEMSADNWNFDKGGNYLDKIFEGLNTDKDGNTGNVLAYGRLDGNFTMPY